MKFYAYCCDRTLADNNGGSLALFHHLCALKQLGHQSGGMLNLTDEIPLDADYIMFQSEWWGHLQNPLSRSRAKRICWLGHYNTGKKYSMPKIEEIKADFFHTQYEGEAVKWGKDRIGKDIYYLPHAGCNICNIEGKKMSYYRPYIDGTNVLDEKLPVPNSIIIRNKFPERNEEWLDYAGVAKKKMPFNTEIPFEDIRNLYKSALVCPNLHGDFQKGIACDFFQTPAYMINDRIFQVILSGGFCISDNNPIVHKFFAQDEVPIANTKEEYKELIDFFIKNPKERIPFMQRAKARILREHLYIHRWKDYLKVILNE